MQEIQAYKITKSGMDIDESSAAENETCKINPERESNDTEDRGNSERNVCYPDAIELEVAEFPSLEMEKDTPYTSVAIEYHKKRKTSTSSYSSTESDEESFEDDESDLICGDFDKDQRKDGKGGKFPARSWSLRDLEALNISYEKKSDNFEEFVNSVKDQCCYCPDFRETISKFTKLMRENIRFSCDMDKLHCLFDLYREGGIEHFGYKIDESRLIQQEIFTEIRRDIEGLDAVPKDNANKYLLIGLWLPAVQVFLQQTMEFVKNTITVNLLASCKDSQTKKTYTKARKKARKSGELLERKQLNTNCFQYLCYLFGEMFFLKHGLRTRRSIPIPTLGRTVHSRPDLNYFLFSYPDDALDFSKVASSLLFIIEVKRMPGVKDPLDLSLEEQFDSGVLGQIGVELIAEASRSVFYPFSLGILCFETKLIFVLLKTSREHLRGIATNKALNTDGKIHYTKPFDILKAEDRDKISEFLYWLGCIQNMNRIS